jgi:hypothetical protein
MSTMLPGSGIPETLASELMVAVSVWEAIPPRVNVKAVWSRETFIFPEPLPPLNVVDWTGLANENVTEPALPDTVPVTAPVKTTGLTTPAGVVKFKAR